MISTEAAQRTVLRERAVTEAPPVDVDPKARTGWLRDRASSVALAIGGILAFVAIWHVASMIRADMPSPLVTARELVQLLSSPLHDGGPNDKGLFIQLGSSLMRVFAGFGVAALVGIPLGFALGASKTVWRAINPLVQVLRPVSPLAWFPIALVLFKDGARASIFTIAVTALWPTLVNTAFGVGSVPQDHRNVARVFRFSTPKYVRHVLVPYSMMAIFTGLRLSMGIAWMVIVATEMLSGGTGIGFFVWDSYNNNNLAAVLSAILFIGLIGFSLDVGFARLVKRFDYAEVAR